MSTADLRNTSQLAIKLWTGRDAAYAQEGAANGRPRRNSFGSAYSHTVLGTGNRVGAAAAEVDHGMACDGCAQVSQDALFSGRTRRSLLAVSLCSQSLVSATNARTARRTPSPSAWYVSTVFICGVNDLADVHGSASVARRVRTRSTTDGTSSSSSRGWSTARSSSSRPYRSCERLAVISCARPS